MHRVRKSCPSSAAKFVLLTLALALASSPDTKWLLLSLANSHGRNALDDSLTHDYLGLVSG